MIWIYDLDLELTWLSKPPVGRNARCLWTVELRGNPLGKRSSAI